MDRCRLKNRTVLFCLVFPASFALSAVPYSRGPSQTSAITTGSAASAITQADKEFLERVNQYVALHKKKESSLKLKPSKDPAKIRRNEQELARRIYLARRDARQGDIFTPAVSAEFRQILAHEFHGPDAPLAVKTVKDVPVKAARLKVNEVYPDRVPFSAVPPTLLMKLPALPSELQYRIVGRYFVLYDVKAHMIADFMERAIPKKAAP